MNNVIEIFGVAERLYSIKYCKYPIYQISSFTSLSRIFIFLIYGENMKEYSSDALASIALSILIDFSIRYKSIINRDKSYFATLQARDIIREVLIVIICNAFQVLLYN